MLGGIAAVAISPEEWQSDGIVDSCRYAMLGEMPAEGFPVSGAYAVDVIGMRDALANRRRDNVADAGQEIVIEGCETATLFRPVLRGSGV